MVPEFKELYDEEKKTQQIKSLEVRDFNLIM